MSSDVEASVFNWPGGARCAASFSFDVDGESGALAALPEARDSFSVMSHQRYGPTVGVRRILEILDRAGVRSTFFVPGLTAGLHPGTVRDIAAAGHEIANHGYAHIRPAGLTVEEQIIELDRGSDAIERATGERPVGYRAPMWDLSWELPKLLADRGFLYDSSLMDDDLPYRLDVGDDGSETLIEVPIQWALDDWEQYCYLPEITELGPIQTSEHAVALWRSELEGIRRYGGCWVLTNHPFLSGRPGRASALEDFIGDVRGMPDVWIASVGEIAAHAMTQQQPPRQLPTLTPPENDLG
ncbi:polysaccharide deacetylase family protein [Leucobacter sp. USHLN153]|uniref:polysaccharide deacetylase family protein n=1 Tax=Leucobacter sp. USHLN153 TaxID=3081268 RepID=UPI003016A1C3